MQKLIIRFEYEGGSTETAYERTDIFNDDSFWEWLKCGFDALVFGFVREEIEK